jgi:hypothetical protein
MKRILIYHPSPFGRMYLCADGTTSSNRDSAAEFWDIQFATVVQENWIINTPEKALAEFI